MGITQLYNFFEMKAQNFVIWKDYVFFKFYDKYSTQKCNDGA